MFANHIYDKELIFSIHKNSKFNRKKQSNRFEQILLKENISMIKMHRKDP